MSSKKLKLLAAKVLIGELTIEEIIHVYGQEVADQIEAIINGKNWYFNWFTWKHKHWHK